MLIKRLILNNFRQYIGTQVVDFSTDREKNVTVLIGVNTSGKTTFIRAFEWILYGETGFDDDILLNKNVADNLQVGETQSVWGTLVIEHDDQEYEITRKENYISTGNSIKSSGTNASISYLQPDGQTKTKLESDFNSNIEKILPRALSSYFFFGGERLGSIATRGDIEASVKGLMGLDVLANSRTHLKKVIDIFKKSIDVSGNQDAERIKAKLDGTTQCIEEYEKELANVSEQLDYYQEEKEKYAALLRANQETKNKQRRREQLDIVISNLEKKIEEDKKEIVTAFSRNSFAFFSLPLLKNVFTMLDKASDQTESVPEMTAASIDYILNRGTCICGTCISKGSAAEKYLLEEKAKQPPESIGAIVRRYREQAYEYISSHDEYYLNIQKNIKRLREDQRDYGFRLDEKKSLNEQLKETKDVSQLESNYQNAANRAREFERNKASIIEKIGSCKKDISNFEEALDRLTRANEKNIKTKLKLSYAQTVYAWVDDAYKTREKSVRTKLEEKVNSNFSLMYHGKRTIAIDEKYRVKYFDVTTEESDGLKAVKSFAFVSGLVDLAKEALTSENSKEADIGPQYYPLVMDAPFSNVDETHISNISKILPSSAEQVIIAVMQKDWEPASEIMDSVVGMSYLIEKDRDVEGNEIDTMTHIRKVEI